MECLGKFGAVVGERKGEKVFLDYSSTAFCIMRLVFYDPVRKQMDESVDVIMI